jgi:hypothetical protein
MEVTSTKMELQRSLVIVSTSALVLLNVYQFDVATVVAAAILASVMILHLRGRTISNFALYAFIIAELSPISLKCGLPTAIVYQLFSVALLYSLAVPFGPFNAIALYRSALAKFVPIALAPLAVSGILIYRGALTYSYNQITAISALSLFLVLYAIVALVHYATPFVSKYGS